MPNKSDEAILAEYHAQRPRLETAATRLEQAARQICDDLDLKDACISSRVKDLQSLSHKLDLMRSKGQTYRNLADVPDVVGVRVVVDDRSQAAEVMREALDKLPVDLPLTSSRRLAVDQLGYRARHLIVRWTKGTDAAVTCELQIRSLLQHAWAQSQRNMGLYKNKSEPPGRIKRRLNILSGLLEMADETLVEALIDSQLINGDPLGDAKISKKSVRAFIAGTTMSSILGRHGEPAGTVYGTTSMSDEQVEAVVLILRENEIESIRALAVNLFEQFPAFKEALAWPEPMNLPEPLIVLLLTSLVSCHNMNDISRVQFLTPPVRAELIRRLGAQDPGKF
jgi:ppGpp synthetase/RelA/SpoT-type nucleotidyltranferase